MTTASSLFGATAVNFMPLGVCAGSVEDGGVAAGCWSFPHAARTEPAPTASTAIPPACSTERRDTALAMSPKYSLSLVLRTGLEQASPHLYRHVTCWRLDFPSWVMKRFNGTSAMDGFLPSMFAGRAVGRTCRNLRQYGNQSGMNQQTRGVSAAEQPAQDVDQCARLVALHRMARVGDDVGALEARGAVREGLGVLVVDEERVGAAHQRGRHRDARHVVP